jgi:uncharacterized caspase-like protein
MQHQRRPSSCFLTAAVSALGLVAATLGASSVRGAMQQQAPEVVVQGQAMQGYGVYGHVAFGGGDRWVAESIISAVRIFDVDTGRVVRVLSLPNIAFGAFAAHPTEDLVALASTNGAVTVFDIATGTERWRGPGTLRQPTIFPGQLTLEFTRNGSELRMLVFPDPMGRRMTAGKALREFFGRSASSDNDVEVVETTWSVGDGRRLRERKTKNDGQVGFGALHGEQVSADGSRTLYVQLGQGWNVSDSRTGVNFKSPPSIPVSAAWGLSQDGTRVATVQHNTLILADLGDPVVLRMPGADSAPREMVTLEEVRAAAEGPPNAATTAPLVDRLKNLSRIFRPSASFTADGRWFVALSHDSRVDVWDAATGIHMPFRLEAPRHGPDYAPGNMPIVVRPRAQPRTTDGWQPIEIEVNMPVTGVGAPTLCRSHDARHVVEQSTDGDGYLRAHLRDRYDDRVVIDLLAAGVDLTAGCRLSPDGARVLAAGAGTSAVRVKQLPTRVYAQGLFNRETSLVIFEVARRRVVATLEDRKTGRAGRFPFAPGSMEWSLDGRFLVGGGALFATKMFNTGPLRGWNAGTGEELDFASMGLARAKRIRFMPGTAHLMVVPDGESSAEIWDLETRQRLASRITHTPGESDAANASVVVGPGLDGSLEIRRLGTGELLGTLSVLGNGEWLVTTPSGLFDGSPGGWRRLVWRTGAGLQTAPGELFFDEFYRPGLLARLLGGDSPPTTIPLRDRDRRQPGLTIETKPDADGTVLVTLHVREARAEGAHASGSGARDVRLLRNGSLVRTWRGDVALGGDGGARLQTRVALASGDNVLVAYAFNRDNIKSEDARHVLPAVTARRPPTVYVLAIGINAYGNAAFDLRYARADAVALADGLGRRQRALHPDAAIQVVTLLDRDATRANIVRALQRLSGVSRGALPPNAPAGLQDLSVAGPEDTVIIYFAGHGAARNDRFYLLPADAPLPASSAGVTADIERILEGGISDLDLEREMEPLDARHLALIIDACQSGQALGDNDQRYGPMNSRGLAQLAYEKGMSILAASQAYQAALESQQLGHGYLTFALVQEALETPIADRTPADGSLTIDEWFDYAVRRVPQLQEEAMGRAQQQDRVLRFDVAPAATGASRLQTPRVFTKRDLSGERLIIARP